MICFLSVGFEIFLCFFFTYFFFFFFPESLSYGLSSGLLHMAEMAAADGYMGPAKSAEHHDGMTLHSDT